MCSQQLLLTIYTITLVLLLLNLPFMVQPNRFSTCWLSFEFTFIQSWRKQFWKKKARLTSSIIHRYSANSFGKTRTTSFIWYWSRFVLSGWICNCTLWQMAVKIGDWTWRPQRSNELFNIFFQNFRYSI